MTGERNYHIFYDLLRGAASDSSLCLDGDPMEYFYLSQSVPIGQVKKGASTGLLLSEAFLSTMRPFSWCQKVPEAAELGMFEHVCHSMEVIGIDQPMRSDLWRVLSGILHLGNTAIVEADTVEGLKAGIEDKRHAALAANMLGVDTDSLVALLTVRRTTIRGQEIVIKLQRDDATFRRDAVAKALYASAFEWIVQCANDHLGYKAGAPLPFIGVLDIFGFESFAVNGLEQVIPPCGSRSRPFSNLKVFIPLLALL
jgi:myosin heavy subunit